MGRRELIQIQEDREEFEHRKMLESLRTILQTESGKTYFQYIFKHYSPTGLPELGLEGSILSDRLGFFRAGRGIFKAACEADPVIAAQLLTKVEKGEYDAKILEQLHHGQRTE